MIDFGMRKEDYNHPDWPIILERIKFLLGEDSNLSFVYDLLEFVFLYKHDIRNKLSKIQYEDLESITKEFILFRKKKVEELYGPWEDNPFRWIYKSQLVG